MSSHDDSGPMRPEFTAVIKRSGAWWIGWSEEVPGISCRARSRAQLLATLSITLREALEMNRRDARLAAGFDFRDIKIAA
jgi:hypothetical protein